MPSGLLTKSKPLRKSLDSDQMEHSLHIQLFTLIGGKYLVWVKSSIWFASYVAAGNFLNYMWISYGRGFGVLGLITPSLDRIH